MTTTPPPGRKGKSQPISTWGLPKEGALERPPHKITDTTGKEHSYYKLVPREVLINPHGSFRHHAKQVIGFGGMVKLIAYLFFTKLGIWKRPLPEMKKFPSTAKAPLKQEFSPPSEVSPPEISPEVLRAKEEKEAKLGEKREDLRLVNEDIAKDQAELNKAPGELERLRAGMEKKRAELMAPVLEKYNQETESIDERLRELDDDERRMKELVEKGESVLKKGLSLLPGVTSELETLRNQTVDRAKERSKLEVERKPYEEGLRRGTEKVESELEKLFYKGRAGIDHYEKVLQEYPQKIQEEREQSTQLSKEIKRLEGELGELEG